MSRIGTMAAVALMALLGATSAGARQKQPSEGVPESIRYYESVSMMSPAVAESQSADAPANTAELSFYTLGRQFDLKLEAHSPFAPGATVRWVDDSGVVEEPAGGGPYYRGRVDGDPGSWVRITMRGDALAGVVSTAGEIYFLEPASRFFGDEAASETLAYRLSDVDTGWIAGSCAATHRAPRRGHSGQAHAAGPAMRQLLADTAAAVAAANLKQADLGMVADFDYFSEPQHGANSANDIAEIINSVDGIYESQIGVTLRLATTVVYTTATDPFGTVTDPNTLLAEVSTYRQNNIGSPSLPMWGTDYTHLVTGRDLDSNVIGIAYIGAVCDPTFGVGVDQDFTTAANLLTLLFAHEMGHNFGAYHDNQAGSPCASTPGTFIMNPVILSTLQPIFSDCSKSFINPFVAAASCLSDGGPAPTPSPGPQPPVLNPPSSPVMVGGPLALSGTGFTAGSVVVFFVATGNGSVTYGPYTPSSWTSTTLTLAQVDPTIPLSNGFVALMVVNTDQNYAQSNAVGALLYGNANLNIPSVKAINGVAVSPADLSVPLANVDAVLQQGSTVTIAGSGFNSPLVALFTASGNVGPLSPVSGWTSTQFSVVIPQGAPTGPGSLQVVNSPYVGNVQSNAVSVPIGDRIHVTRVTQSGSTVTVDGSGFSSLTVISLFNAQSGTVVNLGGLVNGTQSLIPLTLVNSTRFTFQVPNGAMSGPAYVQALNPPFITPASSSGNDPGGGFNLVAH